MRSEVSHGTWTTSTAILSTTVSYPSWSVEADRRQQQVRLLKYLGLLGGLMLVPARS